MFTHENFTGCTQDELNRLNADFDHRWNAGEWDWLKSDPMCADDDRRRDTASKIFSDEISKR